MAEPELEDPVQKKISQFYRETLKMQKIQNVGLMSTIKTLKDEMESTASKQEKAMNTRILPMTQKHIGERLKREFTIERSIETLNERMTYVEQNLQLVLQNRSLMLNFFKDYSLLILEAHPFQLMITKRGRKRRMVNR